ncbi:ATPase (plasmid) [Pseudomonas veronii 1YdBTEX2]|uniref:AAA family ATPase n=2 Tax=Pseudomonas veronii TaxID=76761 RepID=A0A7Y1FCW3_PSEVE|nr:MULTISPECIES: AAA family ATPase [Pseudomonas]MBI6556451.1 AAA family ATPase [Pseudomonas veronii]MBI6653915.1 AAA family ATPase [Pseudomonas veronii]NMY13643.1 AAA family ATPase [Pseudomonas veronii]SBW85374.1 ATPase [Pseudomonas veronii 1YdBTEX2]
MENIDTSTQHEVKTVKEVFDTTSPFFEQMKIKVFPATSHTPVVRHFKFKESSLTRLMLWAAAANLPAGFFGAEMKRNMYTYGPSGCGKTRLVEAFASRTGRPMFREQCSKETTLSDLFGSWKLCGKDQGMKWVYGKVCQWAKTPNAILLLDEWDQVPADVAMGLNGVLDGAPIHLDQTDEIIKIAPGCMIMATGNTNGRGSAGGQGGSAAIYKGTQKMNFANQDRFNVMFETYLTEEEEIDLLKSETRANPLAAKAMASLAAKIRANFIGLNEDAGANGMAFQFTITTRNVLNWSMNFSLLTQMGKRPEDAYVEALRMTVLDFASKDEASAILATWSTIMGTTSQP